MEIRLNFKLGEKTINGRYYHPQILIKEIDKLLKEKGKIDIGPDGNSLNQQTGKVPDDKLVGIVKSYRIDDDNNLWFNCEGLSSQFINYISNNPNAVKLTLFGLGEVDELKNITKFELCSLFTTLDN